jgi:RNA polymerase sigma factor (TIGR02999 family)
LEDLTTLLAAAREGDHRAAAAAFSMVYGELRKVARSKLRAHEPMTLLDTTSLLHECYLRFVESGRAQIADRAHFFAYAARVMRSVIVDFARAKLSERRGGGASELPLDTGIAESATASDSDVVRLSDALEDLAKINPRLVAIVEMRYFAGLTEEEIAAALGVSERTVKRDWQKARLLLRAAIL